MKIGIIGVGAVGGALKRWLETQTHHQIVCRDPAKNLNDDLFFSHAFFVCVPVPTHEDGSQDLGILRPAIQNIESRTSFLAPIFIRSTVLPGTCDSLSKEFNLPIYSMPEFLTERTADRDIDAQAIITGAPREFMEKIRGIFPNKEIFLMSNTEAELSKYAHNVFGAMKVDYFNFIYHLCEKLHLNYERVRSGILMSRYINEEHTLVPGPDGQMGFGGKCFPKDLDAFVRWSEEQITGDGVGVSLLKSIQSDNKIFRSEYPLQRKNAWM